MADIIVFEKYKRKTKRGKGGRVTFRDQLEKTLFGMELKRYRAVLLQTFGNRVNLQLHRKWIGDIR